MPNTPQIRHRSIGTLLLIIVFSVLVAAPSQSVLGQGGPVRGTTGDLWADVIIGHDDFGEFMPNEITGNRLFNPGGVIVDRSVRPNRMYVLDSNSRVLGFNHLGTVTSGNPADIGKPCTSNSDFPGATCTIQEGRPADLVIGQPALDRGACNGDGNFQHYPTRPTASASTLCTMPEFQISTTEGGSFAVMAVDSAGNLYVPDWVNHRVLRYNSPFDTDTVADAVWGQADFSGSSCNRGAGIGHPDAQTLCFVSPTNDGFVAGAAVDADGNLWLTDNANNRVLRFPFNSALNRPGDTPDLVLGQPNFTSAGRGIAMNQMRSPAGVRVTDAGRVYVADSQQNTAGLGRVLYYDPPYSNGMNATGMLNYDFNIPTTLEFDLSGGLWVGDRGNHQLLLFSDPNTISKVLFKDVPNAAGGCGGSYHGDGARFAYEGNPGLLYDLSNLCGSGGSVGVDSDGNVFAAGGDFVQDVWRFPAPFPTPTAGISHSADARIFKPYQFAEHNSTTLSSLYAARGIAAFGNQIMVADESRILFWNNPSALVNGQTADGYVGTTDPRRYVDPPDFGRIRQDQSGHLWALRGAEIQLYALPLTTGAAPMKIIQSPLPVLGGGTITWDSSLLVGGLAPTANSALLWVADPRRHRVFRVRDPLTTPIVDIVLGQTSVSGTSCNQGLSQPSRTSLCHPGAVVLDPQGNLYVSDHALEVEGNGRLLEYDAALFPANPAAALFGIPASRVIGTNGSFTGSCVTMCGPFEPAFSKSGVMVLGINGYSGSRFPFVYPNPLANENHTTLQDYGSMPYASVFDDHDNLYIVDKNRGRALVYHMPFPETTPPTLDAANVVPADDATNVPLNVNITLPFDEPVIAAASAFSLTCGTPQAFTLTGSDTSTLILNPNADLPANTSCTLSGTASGIADRAGNLLVSDFAFQFTTGDPPDTTPPTVSLTMPTILVPTNSNILLTFSEGVNLDGTPPVLACPDGSVIALTTTPTLPATNTTTLALDPVYDLPFTTTCTVSLADTTIVDVAGNPLADPKTFTFSTVTGPSLPDQSPAPHLFLTGAPTLSWTYLSWAASYEVEIDSDKAFTQPRPTGYSSPLPVTGTSLTLPTPLTDGTYYFRVRGISSTGVVGTYSTPEPFTIITGPD